MNRLVEFAVGLLFGLGLILSGMTDPGKVIGFLDVTGAWDPSLACVMGGAVSVAFFAFGLAHKRSHSLLGAAIRLPATRGIHSSLLVGSLVFGVGWGLAGFCPGPALVSAGAGHWQAAVFALAMVGGMVIHEVMSSAAARNRTALE